MPLKTFVFGLQGTKGRPCRSFSHEDSEWLRKASRIPCPACGEELGYGMPLHDVNGQLFHWKCLEEIGKGRLKPWENN
jgi:hypothetical protein